MKEKRQITIKEVLRMLDEGLSREEINAHFNLNPREAEYLWSHKDLKGKKPAKYRIDVVIVDDDTSEDVESKTNEHIQSAEESVTPNEFITKG